MLSETRLTFGPWFVTLPNDSALLPAQYLHNLAPLEAPGCTRTRFLNAMKSTLHWPLWSCIKNTGPRAEIWSETAASSDPLLLGPLSSKRRTLPRKENPFDIKILLEAFLVVKPKTANRLASTSPPPPNRNFRLHDGYTPGKPPSSLVQVPGGPNACTSGRPLPGQRPSEPPLTGSPGFAQ